MIYFWGCSDDCIEVSGDVEEEIYGDESQLVLSNGLYAQITYDGDGEGNWIIRPLSSDGSWVLHPAGSEKAIEITGRDYTDVLEIPSDGLDWVHLGGKRVKL